MASEDKTYCGRGDRFDVDAGDADTIDELTEKLGVSREDVLDAIGQVGHDKVKLEEFFRSKENSY